MPAYMGHGSALTENLSHLVGRRGRAPCLPRTIVGTNALGPRGGETLWILQVRANHWEECPSSLTLTGFLVQGWQDFSQGLDNH